MKDIKGTPVAAVGMSWYARDDYDRIHAVMADADKLPKTFDAWLERAEKTENEIKRRGQIVIRAPIEAEKFRVWCLARGLKVDAKARQMFAAEFAMRAVERGGRG